MAPERRDDPGAARPSAGERRRRPAGPRRPPTTPITYAELDDASAALAARLVAAGVVKGDRVGLLAPNGIEWATTALAVLRVGAVLVPLSTLLRPPELLAQLTTAAVTHLVAVPDVPRPALPRRPRRRGARAGRRRSTAAAATRRPRRCAGCGAPTTLPEAAAPADLVRALEDRVRPADDLAVLFTSGSRGAPKGVDPHPRRRAAGHRRRARGPVRRPGRAALHPDAVLLDGRVRRRAAHRARGRRHPAHRGRARAGPHARPARARAGDAVPGLARPGRPPRRPPRVRRRPTCRRCGDGSLGAVLPARAAARPRAPGRTCSA